MKNKLYAVYSHDRSSWCVFKEIDAITMSFMWKCPSEDAAIKLAAEVNDGAKICRGCRSLRSACGSCVKCRLSED